MSTKQTYPIASKLFPRTKLLVQHGVIKEPKWFPAMMRHPPIVMRHVKKVPKLVYPEDALIRMATNRSKWLELARASSKDFDIPPTALFVTRQMELMNKHKMELHDAFDVTENEFMKKLNADIEKRREDAATRSVMRERELNFGEAERRVADADAALVGQVKEHLGDLALAMKAAEAESGERARESYTKVHEVLDRIVSGTKETVTTLETSAHRHGFDGIVGASTMTSRGKGVYEVTGEGVGGKKKSIVMRRAVTRGASRPLTGLKLGGDTESGQTGMRTGRQVGSSGITPKPTPPAGIINGAGAAAPDATGPKDGDK